MRVVANIPHDEFGVTIFSWNQKYLIKFEQGAYEQTYKVSEFDVAGESEIKELLANEAFMQGIRQRFEAMAEDFSAALML